MAHSTAHVSTTAT